MAIPANLDVFLPREDFNAEGDKPKINEFQEMGIEQGLRIGIEEGLEIGVIP